LPHRAQTTDAGRLVCSDIADVEVLGGSTARSLKHAPAQDIASYFSKDTNLDELSLNAGPRARFNASSMDCRSFEQFAAIPKTHEATETHDQTCPLQAAVPHPPA
jgi:hypothetical protein